MYNFNGISVHDMFTMYWLCWLLFGNRCNANRDASVFIPLGYTIELQLSTKNLYSLQITFHCYLAVHRIADDGER